MRRVVVSSLSLPGMGPGAGRNRRVIERTADWIDRASRDEPDLVVLPESVNGLGLEPREWALSAEEFPGPFTEMVSSRASEHSTYVVCPIVRRDGEGIHNSAILYDRSGNPVSRYDKVHPTIGEMEQGILPGESGVVAEVDFGRVGFAICFDLNFPDLREYYRRGEPDIIVFPSMYRGGIQLRLWAYEIGCFVVSATPGEQSQIVGPLGRVMAESYNYDRIISREVNLDYEILHLDYNSDKFDAIKEKYGTRVRIEVASPEGIFALYSQDECPASREIVEEFSMETREDYFRRAEMIRGERIQPQRSHPI
jgi:predicted amidohydrolase